MRGGVRSLLGVAGFSVAFATVGSAGCSGDDNTSPEAGTPTDGGVTMDGTKADAGTNADGTRPDSGSAADVATAVDGQSDGAEGSAQDSASDADSGGSPCVPPPAGLVGWWPADGNAKDRVGGNDGTFAGTYAPGMIGSAFSITSTSYVSVPTNGALNQTAAMSIEVWFQRSMTFGNADPLVKKAGEGAESCEACDASTQPHGYAIEFGSQGAGNPPSDLYAGVWTAGATSGGSFAGGQLTQPGGPVTNGAWTHAVSTYDGSQVKLYLNGSLVGSAAAQGAIVPSGNPLQFGRDPSNPSTRAFVGLIDDVSLYNRALQPSEVQALYAAGSAGKCSGGSVDAGPSGADAASDSPTE